MGVKVDEEFNHIPKIKDALEYLASHHLEIGIFGEDNSELLMIARVQEFGAEINVTEKMRGYLHAAGLHLRDSTEQINIPERSFMRAGFDTMRRNIRKRAEKLVYQTISLEIPPRATLDALGNHIVSQLQNYLTQISNPPNHPFTVQQKGSSNTLIDEGRLRQSITYKIRG